MVTLSGLNLFPLFRLSEKAFFTISTSRNCASLPYSAYSVVFYVLYNRCSLLGVLRWTLVPGGYVVLLALHTVYVDDV